MKRAFSTSLFLMLCWVMSGSAQSNNEELRKEIELLKQQIKILDQKVNAQPETQPSTPAAPSTETSQAVVDNKDLEARLEKVEAKTAGNAIQWGGDMRVRFDNQHWHVNPYQQFMGTTTPPVDVPGQDLKNDGQYSLRLRLRMTANLSDNLKFMGRLSMYKLYGGSDVPIFNGFPNTVLNSFNASRIPSNDVLRVERAMLRWDIPNVPLTLAFGRMNTSDGPPMEVREGTERQATPQAIMVNAEVDGVHTDLHLDRFGFPEGTTIGICAGLGYESGFGGGGQVAESYTMTPFGLGHINGMKDSRVVGWTYDMPLMFQLGSLVSTANLLAGYNRFTNMTDIPYGTLLNFPIPGPYAFPTQQYVTATNNLGNMNQWGFTWKHKLGDTFTYFTSVGIISSDPNGRVSQYGFGGLLGDPNHSKTGSAVYVGANYNPHPKFDFGVEYNHGSPHWFTYTPSSGEPTDKLAARGNVWEVYARWKFAKYLNLRVGYIDYSYSTAFSGWHIAPGDLDYFSLKNSSAVNFYPFPQRVKNFYTLIETRF